MLYCWGLRDLTAWYWSQVSLTWLKEIQMEDKMESYTDPVQTTAGLEAAKNVNAIPSSAGW